MVRCLRAYFLGWLLPSFLASFEAAMSIRGFQDINPLEPEARLNNI
jgi:hypothetical protein